MKELLQLWYQYCGVEIKPTEYQVDAAPSVQMDSYRYVLLPFLGLLMFMLKSKVRIVASFLISLTPLSYLIPALESFPFTVQTTAAGHTAPISVPLTVGILLSAFIFFLISMISFWYCLRAYPLKV